MIRAMLIVCALAATAYADKPASLAHYNKGKRAYAAGDFALAAAEFERAYAEWKTPEYLHDIAQAYRRMDRCNEAASSFEKYLAAKPDAANRAAVQGHITALRAKCPVATASPAPAQPAAATPPATTPPAAATSAPAPAAATSAPAPVAAAAPLAAAPPPVAPTSTVSVTQVAPIDTAPLPWHPAVHAGVALLDAGDVVMPAVGELSLGVLRDLPLPLGLQVGANLGVTRVPYDDVMRGTVWLAGPELVVAAAYPLAPRLAAIGGVAGGARLVSGLGEGNPFTAGGMAGDSFVMLRVRGELGVAWRANDRVTVRVAPGYQLSPRRSPLATDIRALHGVSLHAGVILDL